MDPTPPCPQCGKPISPGAAQGLCPACLMQGAFASRADDDGPAGRFEPPSIEELAPLFPQLKILELIGQGGMGAVYKARQIQLDRIVALKILPPGIGADPAFAERFTREARALAKLNHSGIVTLYEFGMASGHQPSALDSQLFYFLMEYVDGVNLRQLLAKERLSAHEALAIVPQICDALQYAHDQGIVHRDIKPENILMDRRGRVKVADFGLAKIVGSQGDGDTSGGATSIHHLQSTISNSVIGTPQYMSPEQIHAPGEVDHRADIYALGVVFYQMLTGELPGRKLEAPSKKVSIDVRLDEVVLRAMEQKPELRYQQASILKTQLETIAETPTSRTECEKPNAETGRNASKDEPQFGSREWWFSPAPKLRIVVVLALLVFLTVFGRQLWELNPVMLLFVSGLGVVALMATRPLWSANAKSEGEEKNAEMPARFSRTAIAGACWLAFIPLHFLFPLIILPDWQHNALVELLAMLQALLFWTAPLGATILGWIAVSQIRRPAGRLHGMWLAVFDGLLFPLLAMNAVMLAVPMVALKLIPWHGMIPVYLILLLTLAGLGLLVLLIKSNVVIIRRVWRTVNQPLSSRVPEAETSKSEIRNPQSEIAPSSTLGKWAFGLFLAGVLGSLLLLALLPQLHVKETPAVLFGGTALLISLISGLMSRRDRFGRIAVIGNGVLAILACVSFVAFFFKARAVREDQLNVRNKLLESQEQIRDRVMHPFLRVTVRVLETHTGFDDSKLLRPASLLDDGEVKVLAARYIRVRSGDVTGIQIPEIPRLTQGGGHILSGRTKTLYIKPTLDPGSAHVRYTLEGDVRGDGAKAGSYERLPIRSDSLQLGEWQRIESNSDGGRKQLAVLSVEMEADPIINLAQVGTNATAPKLTFGPVIERTLNDPNETLKDSLISLDSGTLRMLPDHLLTRLQSEKPEEDQLDTAVMDQWLRVPDQRFDALARLTLQDGRVTRFGLRTFQLLAVAIEPGQAEQISPEQAVARIDQRLHEFGFEKRINDLMTDPGKPAAYIFKTVQGQIGILQINGFNEKPRGVKIRYKLVRNPMTPGEASEQKQTSDAKALSIDEVVSNTQEKGLRPLVHGYSGSFSYAKGSYLVAEQDKKGFEFTHALLNDQRVGNRFPKAQAIVAGIDSGGGQVSYTSPAVHIESMPPIEDLMSLKSIADFERVFGPFRGMTDGWGSKEEMHSSMSWMGFSPMKDSSIRVVTVFLWTVNKEKGWEIEHRKIGEGIFRPTPSDSNGNTPSKPAVFNPIPAEAARLLAELKGLSALPAFAGKDIKKPEVMKEFQAEVEKRMAAIEQLLTGTAAEPLMKRQKELMRQLHEHAKTADASDLLHQMQSQSKQLNAMIEEAAQSKPADNTPGKQKASTLLDPAQPLESLAAAAKELVLKYFPDAQVRFDKDEFTASHATQEFQIHNGSKNGETAAEAVKETGPSFTGFILRISRKDNDEPSQALVPQDLHKPYWTTFINSGYNPASKRGVWISYAFGSRLNAEFHKQMLELLSLRAMGTVGFGSGTTLGVFKDTAAPAAAKPDTEKTDKPALPESPFSEKQIQELLKECETIKEGITREELLKTFQPATWSPHTATHSTFNLRRCPYIKADVEFTLSDTKQNSLEERPTDKVKNISKPYLAWGVEDSLRAIINKPVQNDPVKAGAPDPIDRLIAKLSATTEWENGICKPIELPESATAEQLIERVFQTSSPIMANFKLIEARKVEIPTGHPKNYLAVLCQTGATRKIVLLQFQNGGWWNRVYDADEPAKNEPPNAASPARVETITIAADGALTVAGEPCPAEQLAERVKQLAARQPDSVVIQADKATPAKRVTTVMEACKAAGISNVRLQAADAKTAPPLSKEAQAVLDGLNLKAADSVWQAAIVWIEQPETRPPNTEPSGEVVAFLADSKKRLTNLGVRINWNATAKCFEAVAEATNLTEPEVLRIAAAMAESEGYDLSKYNMTGCHYDFVHKDHLWIVFYELKPPTPPGGHFTISIDDHTKKARLAHGQ